VDLRRWLRANTSIDTKRRLRRIVDLGRPRKFDPPPGALDCVIGFNEHGVYCVPRNCSHRFACQAVMNGRVWEPQTLDLIRQQDPTGDIVHAGTFFGDFLPALARSRDGAKVWAFEPSRESFRCAQITVLLNDLSNVSLTRAGLSDAPGKATLQITARDGRAAGGQSRIVQGSPGQTEEVNLVTVDQTVADRKVAVIQLDVEGHEQQALTGALETIARCRPVIVLEGLPKAWIASELEPLGYRTAGVVHGNTVLRASGIPAITRAA
jgi:FkbM family methyltransferase